MLPLWRMSFAGGFRKPLPGGTIKFANAFFVKKFVAIHNFFITIPYGPINRARSANINKNCKLVQKWKKIIGEVTATIPAAALWTKN